MPLKNSVGSQPSTGTARYLSLRCIFSYPLPLRFFLLSLLSHLSFAVIIIIIAIRFFFHEKNWRVMHSFNFGLKSLDKKKSYNGFITKIDQNN